MHWSIFFLLLLASIGIVVFVITNFWELLLCILVVAGLLLHPAMLISDNALDLSPRTLTALQYIWVGGITGGALRLFFAPLFK